VNGLASGFGDLLSGVGKLLGTLQLGSIAEWTAGVIAAVALLVTVVTQRRQQTAQERSESILLRVTTGSDLLPDKSAMRSQIIVKNTSDKKFYDVSILVNPPHEWGLLFSKKPKKPLPMAFIAKRHYPVTSTRGVRVRIGTLEPGTGRLVRANGAPDVDHLIYVDYTDSKYVSWRYDAQDKSRRKTN
jgi:hypothetical protein